MQTTTKRPKRRGPGRPVEDIQGDVALLRAGQSAFARYGYEGASLRSIAAAANVDPALVAHHFGSKEALWTAVVERLAYCFVEPAVAKLHELQKQVQLPIRARLEEALRQTVSANAEEPEFGMFLSRVGAEKGEKLNLITQKLLRPYHDAFRPFLIEAMRAKVIGKQPVEVLYFMLMYAVTMTISYRHILEAFGKSFDDVGDLKSAMTKSILVTFLR